MARTSSSIRQRGERTARDLAWELAIELHRSGAPSHRIEAAAADVAASLDCDVGVLAEPTALTLLDTSSPDSRGRTAQVVPMSPHGFDLGRLAELEKLIAQVESGAMKPGKALAELRGIAAAGPRHGTVSRVVAHSAVAASAGVLIGGGWREAVGAAGCALIVAALGEAAARRPEVGRLQGLLGALLSGLVAWALLPLLGPASPLVAAVAALIVLVPGYTLTVALEEIAASQLASGTSRMAGALGSFLSLGFGLAVGAELGQRWALAPVTGPPLRLAPELELLAVVVGGLGFTVLFQARWRDALSMVGGSALAMVGTTFGAGLSPRLAVFAGALLVGLAGHLAQRWRRRPAALIHVPGVILLVPGSMGLRGVAAFSASDVLTGVETVFGCAMVAISIVAGLSVSAAVLPPRRGPGSDDVTGPRMASPRATP